MRKLDVLNLRKRPLENKEISTEELIQKKERLDLEATSDSNGTSMYN